jgi:hypothetical protein
MAQAKLEAQKAMSLDGALAAGAQRAEAERMLAEMNHKRQAGYFPAFEMAEIDWDWVVRRLRSTGWSTRLRNGTWAITCPPPTPSTSHCAQTRSSWLLWDACTPGRDFLQPLPTSTRNNPVLEPRQTLFQKRA